MRKRKPAKYLIQRRTLFRSEHKAGRLVKGYTPWHTSYKKDSEHRAHEELHWLATQYDGTEQYRIVYRGKVLEILKHYPSIFDPNTKLPS